MRAVQDVVAAFEHLVEQVEASAEDRPTADLAGFQLQALTTTLTKLAGDAGLAPDVAAGLEAVQRFLGAAGGGVDVEEGRSQRDRIAAYAVVADDLDLDAEHLADLVARWDAATRSRPAAPAGRGRRVARPRGDDEAGPSQTCTVCGAAFKRVAKHMSSAHPEEWRRAKGG